jgi:signal transduction histidine kinase
MQHQIPADELLKILDLPAFAVSDGTIVLANDAALQRQITTGMPVASILLTGKETYKTFADGRLHLRLCIADTIWDASVTKAGNTDIFLMERTVNDAELRVLSLAALQLRAPLAEMLSLTNSLSAECDLSNTETLAKLNKTLFSIQRFIGNMADAPRCSNATNCIMRTQNVTAYFREILEKSQHLLEQSGYALNYTLPNEDILALVSTERLERAAYNLLSNAIKFSPVGSTISAKLEKNGDLLLFTVTDQSRGLPADFSGNIFTRYLRDPAIEDSRIGMGLGMLYVCAAASAHGGTVLIRQPEGKGLSVTMTLSTKATNSGMIRSDILQIDYTGGQDHALLELSDVLSSELYK